jgi:hypothetical protein
MKTLIIPDVHEKIERCENILHTYKDVDRRVFLGDFFDSFEWNGRGEKIAQFYQWIIDDPMNTVLLGNHDAPYRWMGNRRLGCSGHTREQELANAKVPIDWNKVRLFTWVDGWLLSHAGWCLNEPLTTGLEADIIAIMNKGGTHPALGAGYTRGGTQAKGGLTWCDWRDEFTPVEGINQIVGHTIGREVRENHTEDSKNYCIDTNLEHVAIIHDGKLEIKKV